MHLTAFDGNALDSIALHYVPLRAIALHYPTTHYDTTGHYTLAWHGSALHCTALHCTALYCTALQRIASQCSTYHCTVWNFNTMYSLTVTLCQVVHSAMDYNVQLYTTVHCITSHRRQWGGSVGLHYMNYLTQCHCQTIHHIKMSYCTMICTTLWRDAMRCSAVQCSAEPCHARVLCPVLSCHNV